MGYRKLLHIFLTAAALSSLAVQAQSAGSGAGVDALAVSVSSSGASPQMDTTSPIRASGSGILAGTKSADVKLAAVASSTELLGSVKARKSKLEIQQTELNGWMLVLIGGFLIWTMSQRRTRSTLD